MRVLVCHFFYTVGSYLKFFSSLLYCFSRFYEFFAHYHGTKKIDLQLIFNHFARFKPNENNY